MALSLRRILRLTRLRLSDAPAKGGPVAPPGFVLLTRPDGTILTRTDGTILVRSVA